MPAEELVVHGAREHNLKDVTVRLPRNALVCITGLSAYARQFLQMMEKPDVDSIDGLSPAISIDQKTTSRNPRSTVGTVTEVYYYLRLLFARIGHPHCPICGREIQKQTVEQMADQVERMPAGTRLVDWLEVAAKLGQGAVLIVPADGGEEVSMSQDYACPYDGISIPEPEPRNFSFNTPHGACPTCTGLGSQLVADADLVIPDPSLSLSEGAIAPWSKSQFFYPEMLEAVSEAAGIDMEKPAGQLTPRQRDLLLNGTGS